MPSIVYELIGRHVVRQAWARHRAEITLIGAGAALAVIGGAYLLSKREPPEG
jgi:hypothetical protein